MALSLFARATTGTASGSSAWRTSLNRHMATIMLASTYTQTVEMLRTRAHLDDIEAWLARRAWRHAMVPFVHEHYSDTRGRVFSALEFGT